MINNNLIKCINNMFYVDDICFKSLQDAEYFIIKRILTPIIKNKTKEERILKINEILK